MLADNINTPLIVFHPTDWLHLIWHPLILFTILTTFLTLDPYYRVCYDKHINYLYLC